MLRDLHSILERQLKRFGLNPETLPADPIQWKEFLGRINKSYKDVDQERYLLERSMEISSAELLDLNKKLEHAQHIAQLGYWFYNKEKEEITLSKELYHILGLDPKNPVPTLVQFMEMVDENHRPQLEFLIERAFSKELDYQYDFRMKKPDGEYRWYSVVAHPIRQEGVLSLTGVTIDITDRKKSEEDINKLHQQLLTAARQAGMSDIASLTLHNVGNVLNTANISAELLEEYLGNQHCKKLFTAIGMLKDKLPIISEYLTQDPKGKLIPQYLVALSEFIEKNHESIIHEVANLRKQLQHIKDIISTQQDISRVAGITEKVLLPQILESALRMSTSSNSFTHIAILKEFEDVRWIITDKTKLMQILINLFQNAKESLEEHKENNKKKIIISLREDSHNNKIVISVKDNGVGILRENLTKIFSFGFTTKEHGHGYGLHASALAAQELAGSLFAESRGTGKGSTFILTLPFSLTSQPTNKTDNDFI